MSSNLIAGTAQFTVDGTTYQLVGNMKYSPSSVKREAMMGLDGFHGWKETPIPGRMSMTVRDAGDLTVANFNVMRNVTVVFTLANGKIVTGRNMGAVDDQEVETEDAKFDVNMQGPQVSEQTVTVS